MKETPTPSITLTWKRAQPIPTLTLGYLLGMIIAFGFALAKKGIVPDGIVPLPFSQALAAYTALELPFWIACTLLGLCRLPGLTPLPVFFRSLLWGYSSLQIYLAAGKSILYFSFVLGSILTLLPLCCLTKLAEQTVTFRGPLTGSDFIRYLCQCLYYWGLTLIILILRSIAGMYWC